MVKVTIAHGEEQVEQEEEFVAAIMLTGDMGSTKARSVCKGDFQLCSTPYALGRAVRRILENVCEDETGKRIIRNEFLRGYSEQRTAGKQVREPEWKERMLRNFLRGHECERREDV